MKLPFKIKSENYRRGMFQVGVVAVATGYVRAFGAFGALGDGDALGGADGLIGAAISLLTTGTIGSSFGMMATGIVLIFLSGIHFNNGDDDDDV